jgi:DNA-binding NtrC family response regulator
MARVLIVDDEPSLRRILSVLLSGYGHEVHEASGVNSALDMISTTPLDLVITDQKMTDGDGLSVVSACRDIDSALPVVMLTAHATVELAVEALRKGAFDFLTKPFSADQVRAVVARACERTELRREVRRLKGQIRLMHAGDGLVGDSVAMQKVRDQIERVGKTAATVLITGETGTGKELAARAVHALSPRNNKPFVALNCAALPESLLESELFGHERGAFTGADRTRIGLFESADQGTLFLDEIGDMPLTVQAKILRVMNDGHIMRVGARTSRTTDVRLVLATHRDLRQRVRDELFREDLYFRINVVPIQMPPLRDHLDDLPALVDFLLAKAVHELKVEPCAITPPALDKLRAYRFPGNVRELRNLIERACILADGGKIGPDDFPLDPAHATDSGGTPLERYLSSLGESVDVRQMLDNLEKSLIEIMLRDADGVQAEAARRLGLSRSDLAYKLKKYGLQTSGPLTDLKT